MTGSPGSVECRIERVTQANLDQLLPLAAQYQKFYKQTEIDEARNRVFFESLIEAPEEGIQHLAVCAGDAVGFSTLYFTRCSVRARRIATLYDLYVTSDLRGHGVGRLLLEGAARYAADLGYRDLEWLTEADNHRAQALYDSLGARRGGWYLYTLRL